MREQFEKWFQDQYEELNPVGKEASAMWPIWQAAYDAGARDMREALEAIIAEADQSNGGKGAKLPIVLYIRELAEAALRKERGER